MVGQRDYSMRLWIKPDVLAKLQVTVDDIVNAIQTQNVQAAAGTIGLPPQPSGVEFQYPVNHLVRRLTANRDMIIGTNWCSYPCP